MGKNQKMWCGVCGNETPIGSSKCTCNETIRKLSFKRDSEIHVCPGNRDTSRNLDYSNCLRCGQPVGSMQVHDRSNCDRYIERKHKVKEARKIIHENFHDAFAMLAEKDKEMMNSYSDEELARVFYNVAKKFGIPTLKCDDRGEFHGFEDLSLRDVKAMAQFVRELRK